MKKEPLIKLEHVSKYYKTETGVSEGMRNINIEFDYNEFVAITGESGSGKTTLLNVLSGLDSYEDGELYIAGEETSHFTVKDWENYRGLNIGFVFQNYNVIDSYTVYQNVVIALEAQGYNDGSKKERALELIERVGLSSHKNQKTAKLSGGQKQRVVIARALAKNAPIILADEPTGNLDSKSGTEIMQLLKEVSKDKLIILVTHNFEEAKPFVTRQVVMSDGSIKDDKVIDKSIKTLDSNPTIKTTSTIKSLGISTKIASRNIFSTPKRTIFTMLLLMISVAAFIFAYSSLIKDSTVISGTDMYVELHDESKRKENFDYFIETYTSDQIKVEPFYEGYFEVGNELDNTFYNVSPNSTFGSQEKALKGRLATNAKEVVISSIFAEKNNLGINSTIKLFSYQMINDSEPSIDYTIVGIYSVSEESWYREESMYIHDDVIVIDYVYNPLFRARNQSLTVDYLQIVGSDRQEIKLLKNKIDRNVFRIIDIELIYEKDLEMLSGIMMLFLWSVLILIATVLFFVTYSIQKNVMNSKVKDFSVYRSIGIREKEVALVIIIEQLIMAVIASILTIIVLELLALNINVIRLSIRHITVLDYIVVSIVFAIFSIRQGMKFNRKIFKVTVIESLKEGY